MTAAARPRSRLATISAPVDALPFALVAIAEAAWVSVYVGLVQEFALQPVSLGLPALFVFVVAGSASARFAGPRLEERWPAAAVALAFAAAAIGWLASSDVRAALGSADLGRAVASNPGGWLAGIAFMRGFAHAERPLNEATVARLLSLGIPALAVAAALGGLVAEPWRSRFLGDALIAAILYAIAGTLGLAFVRLSTVGGAGLAWRRNPAWAALLSVLVASAIWVAIPASAMTGTILAWLTTLVVTPIVIVGLLSTFQARNRRLVVIAFAAAALIVALGQLAKPGPPSPVGSSGAGVGPPAVAEAVPPVVATALGGLGILLVALLVLVLARLWMRQIGRPDGDVAEVRRIDIAQVARARPAPRRRRRRPATAPTDAVTAYVALVEDIASRPHVGRRASETPLEHARRLRRSGLARLSLDLLAADYARVRFGGLAVTAAEDRRAVERWRRLRQDLAVRVTAPPQIENPY